MNEEIKENMRSGILEPPKKATFWSKVKNNLGFILLWAVLLIILSIEVK